MHRWPLKPLSSLGHSFLDTVKVGRHTWSKAVSPSHAPGPTDRIPNSSQDMLQATLPFCQEQNCGWLNPHPLSRSANRMQGTCASHPENAGHNCSFQNCPPVKELFSVDQFASAFEASPHKSSMQHTQTAYQLWSSINPLHTVP